MCVRCRAERRIGGAAIRLWIALRISIRLYAASARICARRDGQGSRPRQKRQASRAPRSAAPSSVRVVQPQYIALQMKMGAAPRPDLRTAMQAADVAGWSPSSLSGSGSDSKVADVLICGLIPRHAMPYGRSAEINSINVGGLIQTGDVGIYSTTHPGKVFAGADVRGAIWLSRTGRSRQGARRARYVNCLIRRQHVMNCYHRQRPTAHGRRTLQACARITTLPQNSDRMSSMSFYLRFSALRLDSTVRR